MKKKFFTVRIPGELKKMVYERISKEQMPLFLFECRAIEKFINDQDDVSEKYRCRRSDKNHIKRDEVLPVFITEDLLERVNGYKTRIGSTKSNIVLQALENKCTEKKGN